MLCSYTAKYIRLTMRSMRGLGHRLATRIVNSVSAIDSKVCVFPYLSEGDSHGMYSKL
jgi:hypothetical protein